MNLLNAPKLRPAPFQIRHSPLAFLAVTWITLAGVFAKGTLAQETFTDEAGAEVLTRGPVHEAFAGMISYDSVPGIVVTAAPPTLIEEIPPGERPIGDDVTWIPGYWAWDDERNDFLWISGIWRALPPGREWIVGYWGIPRRAINGLLATGLTLPRRKPPICPHHLEAWKGDQPLPRRRETTVGRRVAGSGARNAMLGARVNGQRVGPIGIGFRRIMSGLVADMSSWTAIGITRFSAEVSFSRRSILTETFILGPATRTLRLW